MTNAGGRTHRKRRLREDERALLSAYNRLSSADRRDLVGWAKWQASTPERTEKRPSGRLVRLSQLRRPVRGKSRSWRSIA